MSGADVAAQFTERINVGDIDGLASLMSEGHTFTDTVGHTVTGKQACLDAWRSFFAAYPTYRNVFESVWAKDDVVTIAGYSRCAEHPDLDGPALWMVVVEGGLVSEWRVHDDTAEARRRLGIA